MAKLPEVAGVVDQPKQDLVSGPRDKVLAAGGAPAATAATSPPTTKKAVVPFPAALDYFKFVHDDKLQHRVDKLKDLPSYGVPHREPVSLIVAVGNKKQSNTIVFSDADPIAYAGLDFKRPRLGASVPKVAGMVAAYALRDAVQNAAAQSSAKSADELFKQLEVSWGPTVMNKFSDRPADFPNLATIFSATRKPKGGFSVDFKSTGEELTALEIIHHALEHADEDPKVDAAGKKLANKQFAALGFLERMKLMIRWSDNRSAGACIHALGFQYTNGTMMDLGLFIPKGKTGEFEHGIWIDHNYDGTTWWGKSRKSLYFGVDVVAFPLMKFLVALATDALISPEASQQMKVLMDRLIRDGHSSYFEKSLWPRNWNHLYSKVGRAGHTMNDCALVERVVAGFGQTYVWYVAVLLGVNSSPRSVTRLGCSEIGLSGNSSM